MAQLIGYVRVSTQSQADSGLGLAAQKAKITAAAHAAGHELVEIVVDGAEHGTSLDRPGLRRALAAIAGGQAEGLIAAKLDRLSRSVIDFSTLLGWFTDARAALVVLDPSIDTTTAAGRLVAQVFAAVAEWEAGTIAERTKDALAAKRSNGQAISRPAIVDQPELAARIRAMRDAGMTLRAIADRLTADGVPTARGGRWSPSALQAVLGYRRPSRRRSVDLPNPRPRRRQTAA